MRELRGDAPQAISLGLTRVNAGGHPGRNRRGAERRRPHCAPCWAALHGPYRDITCAGERGRGPDRRGQDRRPDGAGVAMAAQSIDSGPRHEDTLDRLDRHHQRGQRARRDGERKLRSDLRRQAHREIAERRQGRHPAGRGRGSPGSPPRRAAARLSRATLARAGRKDGYGLICRDQAGLAQQGPDPRRLRPRRPWPSAYAEGGATCLSVLTDELYFQGGTMYLALARLQSGRAARCCARTSCSSPTRCRVAGARRRLRAADHGRARRRRGAPRWSSWPWTWAWTC